MENRHKVGRSRTEAIIAMREMLCHIYHDCKKYGFTDVRRISLSTYCNMHHIGQFNIEYLDGLLQLNTEPTFEYARMIREKSTAYLRQYKSKKTKKRGILQVFRDWRKARIQHKIDKLQSKLQ